MFEEFSFVRFYPTRASILSFIIPRSLYRPFTRPFANIVVNDPIFCLDPPRVFKNYSK